MKRKKVLTTVLAAAVTCTTVMGTGITAFASERAWTAPTEAKTVDSSVITAAGHRAGQTLVEIVGLNNKACQNLMGNADGLVDGAFDHPDPVENIESNPAHDAEYATALDAANDCGLLGVFGSDLNENPDPYYYNYYYNVYADAKGLAKSNDAILTMTLGKKASPNNADTRNEDRFGGVSASVYARPDILIGSAADTAGTTQTYAAYLTQIREDSDEYDNYNPIVFTYTYDSMYEMGESLQRLALTMNNISTTAGVFADEANTAVGTTGRYGNPLVAANDYQLYIKGLSAYVYSQLEEQGIAEKTAVVIDPCSDVNYSGDSSSMGITETESASLDGGYFRAFTNATRDPGANRVRGAEMIENVTKNLVTELEAAGSEDLISVTANISKSPKAAYAISAKAVMQADVIMLQGAQSSTGVQMDKDEFISYMCKTYGYKESDFDNKIIIDENLGRVYGHTCNSSDGAVGYGFYAGYIYPEILDPVDAAAFFYKKIYHIKDSELQSYVNSEVAAAVSHEKYWNSTGKDNTSTKLSDGWEETIVKDINEGLAYYDSLTEEQQSVFYWTQTGTDATGTTAKTTNFDINSGEELYNEYGVNSIIYQTQKITGVKSAYTVKAGSSKKIGGTAEGKVTYKKLTGDKNITIKSGKIYVKKGTAKKTYTIKVTVKAAAKSNYKAASVTKKIKVTVK